eukprot:g3634.t1 g3634   contig12:2464264-2466036(-)
MLVYEQKRRCAHRAALIFFIGSSLYSTSAFVSPVGSVRREVASASTLTHQPSTLALVTSCSATRAMQQRYSHISDNESKDDNMHKQRWILNSNASTSTQLSAKTTSTDEGTTSSSLQDILILVFPLLLIYISNQWSRYSISYLVDFSTTSDDSNIATSAASSFQAMNIDLQFTQSQYGLLASTAFTILFALSSLLAGSLADRYNRKVLTLASCTVWTMATLAQSAAQSYEQVLIARVIMGGACAFAVPAAYTLIADKISKDKSALANSIYGSGVYLGGALASLSLLLDESLGWRYAMAVIGAFGGVSVAVSGILLPGDGDRNVQNNAKSGGANDGGSDEPSIIENAMQILSIPRVRYLFLASFLRFSSGLMIGVWAAPYYKQAFPDNASEYAVVNAFIVGAMGMSSGILGGYVADWLAVWVKDRKEEISATSSGTMSAVNEFFDEQTIRLLLPIVGSILAIPCWYLTTHTSLSDNAFELAMFWLAVEYLVAECWFGPTIAVLQSTVGSSKTGTAQGMFVLTGAVGNTAPTLLGWIYGNQVAELPSSTTSSEVLADLLGWGVCAGYLLSSVFFAISVGASGVTLDAKNKER